MKRKYHGTRNHLHTRTHTRAHLVHCIENRYLTCFHSYIQIKYFQFQLKLHRTNITIEIDKHEMGANTREAKKTF